MRPSSNERDITTVRDGELVFQSFETVPTMVMRSENLTEIRPAVTVVELAATA